ncbi:dTDP-4-dehydrorhamnose 3,5-epimerase [Kineosphaera limosa]|uniref:dTDP-4-dehydrorhamnose reductase n=1 Tax=Kineosphaera limosa NBRC 100340 TaxID=1184609 RepID=K6X5E0_9MICO|nr:bifunctional dTDP-4-dehydrorhamnose 3,5-epimerase family protein/NAD(P)-dependent oxidoreductase [Kineosphaera limosa]NYE02167.1 dTDP-4-dehydrorhamnose 3,5-epimerase [Kineosphaera limosa]GAB94019.1 dTDP-6-deoxy-D-xylo-4-hexulose 3,5-epimerase/dTDP-6-deoxy-L-lyxo-4-hexulose reductase [Kineosphaera limosa NBRC 100340]
MTDLAVHTTDIPGLLLVDLPVHGDNRGWFKENWQRAKMTALGLPDFWPVQQNVSFNDEVGVTRGIHAEPWDKFVSVATGRVFGAWVDLREGESHGRVVTSEITPGRAVFVPRGVGNAYQTLEPATAYSYLVNDHWSPAARDQYTFVGLHDESLGIDWPVPLADAILSEADKSHPLLIESRLVPQPVTLMIGAGGQLGQALATTLPDVRALTRAECDLTDPASVAALDLSQVQAIVNAAAYTAVDAAESAEGRREAWAANVTGVAAIVARAREHGIPIVHVSSDYVFDGVATEHDEDEPFSPLGVYGQTKAAGDAIVASYERHYIVRTTWVVGEGKNFVATMAMLADKGISPTVVDDQFGRLTFTADLAEGIAHLLATRPAYGTYNLTNTGPARSWADIAADVFELRGRDRADVSPVSTAVYGEGKNMAPRPTHSALQLNKIVATGFTPASEEDRLRTYVAGLAARTVE